MANLIHRLHKNKSVLRIFTNLKTLPELPKPTPNLMDTSNPVLVLDSTTADDSKATQKYQFYPSFPFGYCMNPVSSFGMDESKFIEKEDMETDDATTVWADSVKKKRKKKMNKHKYKKLRKRLRRKT